MFFMYLKIKDVCIYISAWRQTKKQSEQQWLEDDYWAFYTDVVIM